MSWLSSISADGRLRKKHERMAATGERPTYLTESYTALRHLEEESNRLAALGYRIQTSQDTRSGTVTFYNVTFVHVGGDPA